MVKTTDEFVREMNREGRAARAAARAFRAWVDGWEDEDILSTWYAPKRVRTFSNNPREREAGRRYGDRIRDRMQEDVDRGVAICAQAKSRKVRSSGELLGSAGVSRAGRRRAAILAALREDTDDDEERTDDEPVAISAEAKNEALLVCADYLDDHAKRIAEGTRRMRSKREAAE